MSGYSIFVLFVNFHWFYSIHSSNTAYSLSYELMFFSGDPKASFTKEEMHAGLHQVYERKLHNQLLQAQRDKPEDKHNNSSGTNIHTINCLKILLLSCELCIRFTVVIAYGARQGC